MKQLNQLNLEEFRLFRNFTIEQMVDVLQISVGKYESIKDQKVTYYAHCQEMNNLLIEEVGKEIKEVCERYGVNLCAKKESIVRNTLKINNDRYLEVLEKYLSKLKKTEQPI
ncbi:hypothetical protein [Bacillus mycoides]|uniref:hypothetical protein n=1 Tax=Bacillus mycoides TaxID=1405 RepID=UPI002112B1F5|nr:hypothetical protein [Bacillus mycoides]MCQ6528993.1 hypothetical protein [Bacillus mycoides]